MHRTETDFAQCYRICFCWWFLLHLKNVLLLDYVIPMLVGMTVFVKVGDDVELGEFDDERNANSPTVRMYTTNPGGELAFAQYSGTVGVVESGEFYLDDNWEETGIAAAARGFVPVQCSAGFISNDDIPALANVRRAKE